MLKNEKAFTKLKTYRGEVIFFQYCHTVFVSMPWNRFTQVRKEKKRMYVIYQGPLLLFRCWVLMMLWSKLSMMVTAVRLLCLRLYHRLVWFWFSDPGLNPGCSSESQNSNPLGYHGTPVRASVSIATTSSLWTCDWLWSLGNISTLLCKH